MEIDSGLYKEIKDYCKFNNLVAKDYINGLLRKAFNEDRYGKAPFANIPATEIVDIETIPVKPFTPVAIRPIKELPMSSPDDGLTITKETPVETAEETSTPVVEKNENVQVIKRTIKPKK